MVLTHLTCPIFFKGSKFPRLRYLAYLTHGFTGTRGEAKCDVSNEHSLEYKPIGTGRGGHFSSDNG